LPHSNGNWYEDPASWKYLLLGLCFNAAGGKSNHPENLSQAWFFFLRAAHILDNLEDQDPSDFLEYTQSELLNGSTGLLVLGFLLLDRYCDQQQNKILSQEIKKKFYYSLLRACQGQAEEFSKLTLDLSGWWRIAAAKSAGPYSLACWIGARVASDRQVLADKLGLFGHHLGLLIQLLDDTRDFFVLEKFSEGIMKKFSPNVLPIVYTRQVLPPRERTSFDEFLSMDLIESATYVFEIVQRAGALLYIRTEIEKHSIRAKKELDSDLFFPPARDELIRIINNLISVATK
jgi:geranylgeranyl diphosphate synthase type I